jgi:hypothetical protein
MKIHGPGNIKFKKDITGLDANTTDLYVGAQK